MWTILAMPFTLYSFLFFVINAVSGKDRVGSGTAYACVCKRETQHTHRTERGKAGDSRTGFWRGFDPIFALRCAAIFYCTLVESESRRIAPPLPMPPSCRPVLSGRKASSPSRYRGLQRALPSMHDPVSPHFASRHGWAGGASSKSCLGRSRTLRY